MKHLFVPYTLALLAKEKGFDEECLMGYYGENDYGQPKDKLFLPAGFGKYKNSKPQEPNSIAGPLYQQLVQWFYEHHRLMISVIPWDGDGEWFIYKDNKTNIVKQGVAMFVYDQYRDDGTLLVKGGWTEALKEAFSLI